MDHIEIVLTFSFVLFCVCNITFSAPDVLPDIIHEIHQELKIEVMRTPHEGCERKSKRGDLLKLHYTGWLENGTQFDSSFEKEDPLDIQIGVGQVIRGWDNGLIDMCKDEVRLLHVPSEMAYGKTGAGENIPPNTDLKFEVQLLEILDGPKVPNVFKEMDVDADNRLSRAEVHQFLEKKMQDYQATEFPTAGDETTTPPDTHSIVDGIFIHEDKNLDGTISFDEFSGPKHDEL